jgi:hypothetical protein
MPKKFWNLVVGLFMKPYITLVIYFVEMCYVEYCIFINFSLSSSVYFYWGTAVAQWLRYCATNLKVAGSIPDGVSGIFH